ncbi:hypothetical protein MSZK_44610 [Mycobacterium sp. shizuoka-1]|nr:hypothetical protein MSZK_44610 [Mycobacterium sp. shizuoka-1]
MAAPNRSAHPNLPGVPWWAAVLIAVIATTIGFAFDAGSGSKELGNVFAALYAVGCVAAVLAVRQSSIFTAVIQPPLILFVAVPSAYFLFHGAAFTGIKDTLINFGYPLIERFPLMLFTSAGVLLIGLVRWYFAMSSRSTVVAAPTDDDGTAAPSLFAGLAAKLTSVLQRGDVEDDDAAPRNRHGIDRPASAERRPRSGRPAKRPAPTRSRHARPPLEDITEAPDRPRRQSSRRRPAPDADAPGADSGEIPRRRRQPRDPSARTPSSSRREPREPRDPREPRVPRDRRDPYAPPPQRSSRFEPYEPYPSYEPYPPYEPPPRQRPPGRANGDSSTHHPVSRVRYRGEGEEGQGSAPRPRRSRDLDAESWRPER